MVFSRLRKGAFQYGDAPVQHKYMDKMKAIVRTVDEFLNGTSRGRDRKIGFVLLVFEFGEQEGRCNYMSNGASRADVVKLLKEQAARFEADLGRDGDDR